MSLSKCNIDSNKFSYQTTTSSYVVPGIFVRWEFFLIKGAFLLGHKINIPKSCKLRYSKRDFLGFRDADIKFDAKEHKQMYDINTKFVHKLKTIQY